MNINHIGAQLNKNFLFIIWLFIIGIVSFFGIFIYSQFTIDDAYITWRFGKNFVEYGIWNWNPSGDPVEATTSFLYAVISILPNYFNISVERFFRILGLVLMASLLYKLIRTKNKSVYYFGISILLLHPFTYIHMFSGLETPLFISLIFWSIVFTEDLYSKSYSSIKLLIVLLLYLLMPLTRPEGFCFSFFLWLSLAKKLYKKKGFWLISLVIILLGAMYMYLRYKHFGYLLPNTFYIKSVQNSSIRLIVGNLSSFFPYILVLFLLSLKTHSIVFRSSLFSVLAIVIVYSFSSLAMNYADRFIYQLFLPIYLAYCMLPTIFSSDQSIVGGDFSLNIKQKRRELLIVFDRNIRYIFLGLLIIALLSCRIDTKELTHLAKYYPNLRYSHKNLGLLLSEYGNKEEVVVVGDAGAIPYYSGWYTIDPWGLGSEEIAHEGFSLKILEKFNPEVIILYSAGNDENQSFRDNLVNKIPYEYVKGTFDYEYVGSVKWIERYWLGVYLKTDMENYNRLKNSINSLSKSSVTREDSFRSKVSELLRLKYW